MRNNRHIKDIVDVYYKYGKETDLVCNEDSLFFLSFLSIIEPASKRDISAEFDISLGNLNTLINKLLEFKLISINNKDQLVITKRGTYLLKSFKLYKLKIKEQPDELLSIDPNEFENIVKTYKKKVYYLAYDIVRDHNSAEDISQEVFVKAFRSLSHYKGDAKFSTWLYQIVVNTSIDCLRKTSTSRHELSKEDLRIKEKYIDKETYPEKDHQIEEMQKQLSIALQKVSPRERSVFVMRHYGDFEINEIAKILGVSSGTVKSLLYRAIKNLKANMKELLTQFKYS